MKVGATATATNANQISQNQTEKRPVYNRFNEFML